MKLLRIFRILNHSPYPFVCSELYTFWSVNIVNTPVVVRAQVGHTTRVSTTPLRLLAVSRVSWRSKVRSILSG